ncbi:F-box/LRR-repeat protein 4-like [Rhododendron vialii]|uniref:F-box/LRR-repeat protein 4-like n=1 Tax=Rhododendron vialii TaxID=182163 RepID=UPI00265EDA75|nr:F-box/LRR-repeat protein 4-like [Rhododendron vialii]
MKKQGHGHFPDDCWELIFQKLREDDERHLGSISLVSKRFLSISNRMKLSLKYVNNETLPLLPNLLQRFRHIEPIVIHNNPRKDIDGLVDLISRSGVLNLQAIRFRWCMTEPPRDGFKALALNKNIKNNMKVLDCSGFISIQDSDLVLIADCFPRLEELRIHPVMCIGNDKFAARITDDGVEALASKLKQLKEIALEGHACFITDQSLISLSTNCVELSKISIWQSERGQHNVTVGGIDFVMRHSPNLTSLSLDLSPLQPSAFSFSKENAFTNAKNLHSLTMCRQLISSKNICLVAKAHPPLKMLKLVGFEGQYFEIHGALKLLLQACQLTLEDLTLACWSLIDTGISDLAQHLSNLTFIDLHGSSGLTSATFYTLTKSCPLLQILKMAYTRGLEMNFFFPDYLPKNYHMRHLDISGNIWLTDMTLMNFVQVFPNLQFLDVSYCEQLTFFSIEEVLRRCPFITQLNINHLKVSCVFGRYSDHFVVNLKTLKARETQINDEGMSMIGNRCRNLQHLDIGCCENVTDKGVMEVVRNCERLSHTTLVGCKNVSTDILLQMVSSRPSLGNIEPPCFGDLSEEMINGALSSGCRLAAKSPYSSSN